MVTGLQDHFDWKSVAVSAISAPLNQALGLNGLSGTPGSGDYNALGDFASRFIGGAIQQRVRMAVYKEGKLNVEAIAADAFGNMMGNSIVDSAITSERERFKQSQEDRRDEAIARAMGLTASRGADTPAGMTNSIVNDEMLNASAKDRNNIKAVGPEVAGSDREFLGLLDALSANAGDKISSLETRSHYQIADASGGNPFSSNEPDFAKSDRYLAARLQEAKGFVDNLTSNVKGLLDQGVDFQNAIVQSAQEYWADKAKDENVLVRGTGEAFGLLLSTVGPGGAFNPAENIAGVFGAVVDAKESLDALSKIKALGGVGPETARPLLE